MHAVEGLSFRYAVHELPRGRVPFTRWRWELWHGSRLEAAGWRSSDRDATRSVRLHAARVAFSLLGMEPPPERSRAVPPFPPGTAVRVTHAGVAFSLLPTQLELPVGAQAVS